MYKIYSKR